MTIRLKHAFVSVLLLALLSACGSQMAPYQGVKLGKPYEVAGRTYKPNYNPDYDETGIASWYGPGFHGGRTASGERYNQNDMTAAHKTLPLPSIVRVTNLDNGRSAIVRINDRGPFASNRIIDLSRAAAIKLGVYAAGTAKVRVQFLDEETREYVSRQPNGQKSLLALDKARETNTTYASPEPREHQEIYTDNEPQLQNETPASRQDIFSVVDTHGSIQNAPPSFVRPVSYQRPAYSVNNKTLHGAGSVYFVQVGTFGVKDNANRLLQQLEEVSNAKIVENVIRERTLYRVLAGPYRSNAEAESMLSRIGGMGISGAKIIKG